MTEESAKQGAGRRARRVVSVFAAVLLGFVVIHGAAWLMALVSLELFLRVFGGARSSLLAILLGPDSTLGREAPVVATRGERVMDRALFMAALTGWILAAGRSMPTLALAFFLPAFLASAVDAMTGRAVLSVLFRAPVDRTERGGDPEPGTLGKIDAAMSRLVRRTTQGRLARVRLLMVAVSACLAVGMGLAGLRLYARQLGIRIDSFHNDLNYWEPDPELGFVNRAHIDEFNHFVLKDETNERGFRHARATLVPKPKGTTRIVAIGDSVTWGVGVGERHNFCGALEAGLSEHGDYEVVNAGVIGYSAWQEWRLFESRVRPLDPDVVLINLCENDILPTQDPFDNLREIQIRYFKGLLDDLDNGLTEEDRKWLKELILLHRGESVWGGLGSAPEAMLETARRVLVRLPYQRLAQRCDDEGILLVCLLIPPDHFDPVFERLAEVVKPIAESSAMEAIDFREILSTKHEPREPDAGLGFRKWLPFRLRDLENIRMHRRMEWIHRERHFIDSVHLSRRGHAAVAEEVRRLLLDASP